MGKNKTLKFIVLLLVCALLTAAAGCVQTEQPEESTAPVAEAEVLDYTYPAEIPPVEEIVSVPGIQRIILTGHTVKRETLDALRNAFPDCEILYDIEISGEEFPCTADALELKSLNAQDIEKLEEFSELRFLKTDTTDSADALEAYIQKHPEVTVIYGKNILGVKLRNIDTYLDLSGSTLSVSEIQKALQENPEITEVGLVNSALDNSEKAQLHELFPDIVFYYMVDVRGQEMKSTETRFDFTRVFFDDGIHEIADILKCFMYPEWVDVSRQFFENSEMEWIQQQFPDTVFAWVVPVGTLNIRTDQEVFNGTETLRVLKTSNIENLKYCKKLKALDLTAQSISDISCLADLENIEYLRIGGNSITDLSPLRNMKNLRYLEVYGNGISDISALAACDNLEHVNLNRNSIEDITPLLKLKNLKCVYISQNPVSSDDESMDALHARFPEAEIVSTRESARGGFADTDISVHADAIFKGKVYLEAE